MKVTTIQLKGESVLVEYVDAGHVHRCFVPSIEVSNGDVADEVVEQGIPYGYPWEDIEIKFDGARFANELHNVDIWTLQDALKYPKKVWSAFNATIADGVSNILLLASSEKKRGNKHGN